MKLVPAFVSLLLIVAISAKKDRFRCGYEYYPDAGGWLKYHEIPLKWHDARLRCNLEGAVLASPLTSELTQAIVTLRNKKTNGAKTYKDQEGEVQHIRIHTGFHDTFSSGEFVSIEGVLAQNVQFRWSPGSANRFKRRYHILRMNVEGRLSGGEEDATLPYMCYKKYEPLKINDCGTFDNGYVLSPETGNCYKFHDVARPWPEAYLTCSAEDAQLLIVNSVTEAKVIKKILARNAPKIRFSDNMSFNERIEAENLVFVGLKQEGKDDEMMSIEGQKLNETGYHNYDIEEGDGRCGAFTDEGLIIKKYCDHTRRFICEKNPEYPQC